jgi:GAF domain-containing protein
VIGVLDIQSRQSSAFSDDDITTLQAMTDQLAVAVENARLIQQLNQSIRELEQAYGSFTQGAWQSFVKSRAPASGYHYQPAIGSGQATGAITSLQHQPLLQAEAWQALEAGNTFIWDTAHRPSGSERPEWIAQPETDDQQPLPEESITGQEQQSTLAVPIKLRDQVIGLLDLRFGASNISDEIVSLVEEAASRLGLVLESTRLLREAQRLASREQQINWIAAQVRSSANMETILQNTVRELGRALGAARTYIQIGPQYYSEPLGEEASDQDQQLDDNEEEAGEKESGFPKVEDMSEEQTEGSEGVEQT